MSDSARHLPQRACNRLCRTSGWLLLASTAIPIILTNIFMDVFSVGLNLPGLQVPDGRDRVALMPAA